MPSLSLDLDFQLVPFYYDTTLNSTRPRRPDYYEIELNGGELHSPPLFNDNLSTLQELLDNYLYYKRIAHTDWRAIAADPKAKQYHDRFAEMSEKVVREELSKPKTAAFIEDYICKKYNLASFDISVHFGALDIEHLRGPKQDMAKQTAVSTKGPTPNGADKPKKKHRLSNLFKRSKKAPSPNPPETQLASPSQPPAMTDTQLQAYWDNIFDPNVAIEVNIDAPPGTFEFSESAPKR